MYKLLFVCAVCVFSGSLYAQESEVDLNNFAQRYFAAMVATQAPEADQQALENYLSFLADDIGHTHLPWFSDDTREPEGKARMREGMTFYLGAHTEYSATLLNVFTFNQSAIAIRYEHHAKGFHPESKEAIEYTEVMMELLEIEDGKVAVIRKYHEWNSR